jgi:hypothetical protein
MHRNDTENGRNVVRRFWLVDTRTMTERDISHEEQVLRGLLVNALDGAASAEQIVQLNELLSENEQLRHSTARFLLDDSILAEEIGTIEQAIAFFTRSAEGASGSEVVTTREPVSCPKPVADQVRSPARSSTLPTIWTGILSSLRAVNNHGLAVLAAGLLIAIGFGWHYWSMLSKFDSLYAIAALPDPVQHQHLRNGARENATLPGTATVARVTGQIDCKWPSGELPLKFGDQLAPGQRFQMSHGLMQLTFETGARVVIEGPADFIATTGTEAELAQGRISAAVPHIARGYTVLTPTSEVVDLGTEFGVTVDDSGNSEVHVFNGDVIARPRKNGVSESDFIHAREDEAVQFDGSSKDPQHIPVDRKKFIRRLIPDLAPEQLPPLPVTKNLALWLAAEVMPQAEENGPVSIWPDILIGDNRLADDAWQFDERCCPTWIHDDKGLPAVRFDGWSTYMATNPMETGDRQTAFVVFAASPTSFASQGHGGMLLKYGLDSPSLEFALLPDRSPRARVWAGTINGSNTNVGVLQGKPVEPLTPCAVAFTYDAEQDRAELIVNGKSQGTTTAPNRLEQHAKKYIGSHAQPWYEAYFLGNIYEIIIYDTALDVSDRDRVFAYLSTRYGFSLGE